jgi:glycosyltransferase involved in cell wall biosynthesis
MLFLAPIVPAESGNGLAMRAGRFLDALSRDYSVDVVVVPVAGGSTNLAWAQARAASLTIVPAAEQSELRQGVMELLRSPTWRTRFSQCDPLPPMATGASPALADEIVRGLDYPVRLPIHVMRSYLAPLGLAIAERIGTQHATLDLDDDDQAYLQSQGELAEAEAYGRLIGTFAPLFSRVWLASEHDAHAIAERHGIATAVLPNVIATLRRPERIQRHDDSAPTLLFVGNLTYRPNVEAAITLVGSILPTLSRKMPSQARVILAGRYERGSELADLALDPDVELAGFVEDLRSVYCQADVAVLPITTGGGTRIKILEAFAYGVPVVTTRLGARGLGVEDGVHLLLAEEPQAMADAVARVATDAALARRLTDHAAALVRSQFSPESFTAILREQCRAVEPKDSGPDER